MENTYSNQSIKYYSNYPNNYNYYNYYSTIPKPQFYSNDNYLESTSLSVNNSIDSMIQSTPTQSSTSADYYSNQNNQSSPIYYNTPMNSYYNYNYSYYQQNSNDSGYQSDLFSSSPIVYNSKFELRNDILNKSVDESQIKKRKRVDDNLNQSTQENKIEPQQQEQKLTKCSNSKRPKVLKLQNLESADVELKCQTCLAVFYSASKLLVHQFVHHKNGSSKQCPICYRTFGSSSNAMVHLRGHTQEKLYRCGQCDRSFIDISTLQKHKRIHSGEKPYECRLCSKRFSQSGNLSRHLLSHRKNNKDEESVNKENLSENQNYSVPICSNFFYQPTSDQYQYQNHYQTNQIENYQPSYFSNQYQQNSHFYN